LLSEVQHMVKLAQRAERIQLDGKDVDIAHGVLLVSAISADYLGGTQEGRSMLF
jgi:hypothetical protein